ncbi:uncharacterized protein LOC135845294 [Planococcus citri]|uniref:uncharacterized protein LOC135845294 n=1 Tax=Planococcus citri TaxID=170843 RepID=UPI0031F81539
MSLEEPFCGTTFANVHLYYLQNLQDFIDIPIFIIGVIFNIFNILVFTRWNRKSPVNLIFTHLTFANLSELLAWISFTWVALQYNSIKERNFEEWTYTQAVLLSRSGELGTIFYRISMYIIIMLAIWKYIAVFYPSKESEWCYMKTTRNTLVARCILLLIPQYLSHNIETIIHRKAEIHLNTVKTDSIMYTASQIIKVGLYELFPSLVLPTLGIRLIVKLWTKKEHPTHSSNVENSTDNVEMNQQTNRSVIISMIIAAQCLSFVIPLGLVDLVRAVFVRSRFSTHNECVASFRVILNLLDSINKSITFVIYYAMDQDFRVTFKSLFDKNNASFWKLKYVSLSNTRGDDERLEIDRV